MKSGIEFGESSASGSRFAIVVSRWNASLTSKLADGAVEALTEAGAAGDAVEIFHVPGAFELPLAAKKTAEAGRFDAVIALGVVIRGETPHFDFVAGQAAAGIMQASIETGVPVMFGVVTADTPEQAADRCGGKVGNKGREAARSAIEMIHAVREIESGDRTTGKDKVFPHVV